MSEICYTIIWTYGPICPTEFNFIEICLQEIKFQENCVQRFNNDIYRCMTIFNDYFFIIFMYHMDLWIFDNSFGFKTVAKHDYVDSAISDNYNVMLSNKC